jgi:hypothetical protein
MDPIALSALRAEVNESIDPPMNNPVMANPARRKVRRSSEGRCSTPSFCNFSRSFMFIPYPQNIKSNENDIGTLCYNVLLWQQKTPPKNE